MKIHKNLQKSQFDYLEKGALELCHAATTKSRQIERSVFFSTGHQQTNLSFRLVLSLPDVRLWRWMIAPPPHKLGLGKSVKLNSFRYGGPFQLPLKKQLMQLFLQNKQVFKFYGISN